jgi:hypothetical protein
LLKACEAPAFHVFGAAGCGGGSVKVVQSQSGAQKRCIADSAETRPGLVRAAVDSMSS